MVNVTLRSVKGSSLTHTEMDANWTNLKTAVELVPANQFNVTVALDDEQGLSKYLFNGYGTVNDFQPKLLLLPGFKYYFNIDASGHPFYITIRQQATASTVAANAWTNGVTGNGTDSGTVSIEIMHDFPSTLHYHCGVHTHMNGEIKIIGV